MDRGLAGWLGKSALARQRQRDESGSGVAQPLSPQQVGSLPGPATLGQLDPAYFCPTHWVPTYEKHLLPSFSERPLTPPFVPFGPLQSHSQAHSLHLQTVQCATCGEECPNVSH